MSVYFVYRSHYEGPSGKHVRRLDAGSVLGWFQAARERAKGADDASEWVKAEIGCARLWLRLDLRGRTGRVPAAAHSDRQLRSYLEEHLRRRRDAVQASCVAGAHRDDEIELAYYVFDDHYVRQHPGMADYLLHEDWKLPTSSGGNPCKPAVAARPVSPRGVGAGETYLAFLAFYDSGSLSDLHEFGGPCRIKGVRVPQLAEYLGATVPDEAWPFEMKLLRSQIHPDDSREVRLGAALERVARLPVLRNSETDSGARLGPATVEQTRTEVEKVVKALGGVPDHDASKSLVGTSDHLVQLCLHAGNCFGNDLITSGSSSTTSGRAGLGFGQRGAEVCETVGCPL
ncbi:MAG: hypothetical protein WKF75_02155 [Singulisphaera sp.]